MSDISGTYQRVSMLEAARILGVSPTTVRRMVRTGALQAERVLRPQGHTFLVLVPADSQSATSNTQQVSAEVRTEVPPSEQFASMAAAILAPILGPLVAEQAALRQTVERQSDQLVAQAEAIGRLTAENYAFRIVQMTTAADLQPESSEWTVGAITPRWRRMVAFWPLLVAVALVGLLVLVPR